MPTPSDGTAVPERSHADMVAQAERDRTRQDAEVQQQRDAHTELQSRLIPHEDCPPVIGTRY